MSSDFEQARAVVCRDTEGAKRAQGPNVYMEAPDLEAALKRVKELGGTAGEIRDIPALLTTELPSVALHGRFAGCKDSEGNMFHLWQRNSQN